MVDSLAIMIPCYAQAARKINNSVSQPPIMLKTNLISNCVEEWYADSGIPGVAAAVVRNGEIEWFQGFGETEVGNGITPSEHSRFRIASNTKTFTTVALMLMTEASMLSLEDPLLVHLPEFTSAGNLGGDLEDVTLRRLATHHSGLVSEHPLTDWSRHSFPKASEILNEIDSVNLVIPIDSAWKYSNLAYGLLGEVIHRLSGKSYDSWLTEEILRPLGMKDSTLRISQIPNDSLVNGYIPPRPGTTNLRPAPVVELNGMTAAGEMWSSVSDLAKWIGFMTDRDQNGETGLISRRYLNDMIRPVYVNDNWTLGQCMGWRAIRSRANVYLGHGGGIHGFASATIWNKPSGVGVILLASLWPLSTAGNIAKHVLDIVLDQANPLPNGLLRPDALVEGCAESPLSRYNGTYFAEPGLTRDIVAISQDTLHLGFEDSALSGRIPTIATTTSDVRFTVQNGRAAGESFTIQEDGSFRMSNFTYEPVES